MPLTPEHGAPLRRVAPGRACCCSVTWVERLAVLADAVPITGATIARTRLQRRAPCRLGAAQAIERGVFAIS
jgi:DMSO/TMAO reductase YedYZ molybdopterin-dependent catalytic subunit